VTNSPSPGGYPSIPAGGRVYDATAKANYSYSGGYIWSFQDSTSVKAIVKFAQDSSYGGIMVYDYPAGYDTSFGDVLARIVYRDATAGNGSVPPVATTRNQLYRRW